MTEEARMEAALASAVFRFSKGDRVLCTRPGIRYHWEGSVVRVYANFMDVLFEGDMYATVCLSEVGVEAVYA